MLVNPFALRGLLPSVHIGTTSGDGQSTIYIPPGAQALDLALVHYFYPGGGATSMPPGWATEVIDWSAGPNGNAYFSMCSWKVLTAGEVSSPPTITGTTPNAQMSTSIHRGPTSASLVQKLINPSTASTLSFSAFTPHAQTMGLYSAVADRDFTGTPTPPSGFASRSVRNSPGGGFSTIAIADMLDVLGYAGGALQWSTFAGVQDQAGFLYELRG